LVLAESGVIIEYLLECHGTEFYQGEDGAALGAD
jgi:glutathione S-transferase